MGLNHTAGTDPDTSADKMVEIGWGAHAKSARKSDFQKSAIFFVEELRCERLEGSKRSGTTLLLW
eukprot:358574-Rhodomonas_salina.1